MKTLGLAGCLLLLGFCLGGPAVFAASPAADQAGDLAYRGGWQDGSNGGKGFAPWHLAPCGQPHFESKFFVGSQGWGIAADDGDIFSAFRSFLGGGSNGSNTLGVGQRLTVTLLSGAVSAKGAVGFALNDAQQNERVNLLCQAKRNYTVVDKAGKHELELPYSTRPLQVTYEQRVNGEYVLTLTPEGEPSAIFHGSNSSDIATIRAWNFSAGKKNGASFYLRSSCGEQLVCGCGGESRNIAGAEIRVGVCTGRMCWSLPFTWWIRLRCRLRFSCM